MRVAGDALRPFRERFLHDLGKKRGNTWICHNQTRGATTTLKWRGECANGMDERCEANLLIASVRPAVGRAVFMILGARDFSLEEGYFIPVKLSLVDVKLVQHVKEAIRKVRETNVQRQKFIDDGDFCDRVAF